ncbi:uncharacterized protein LOC142980652 isoform X2 [Anticarsia gemmatalis]
MSKNVVRQLFPADKVQQQADKDNLENAIIEIYIESRERGIREYNFDTFADEPIDGTKYKWCKPELSRYDWVGVRIGETTDISPKKVEEKSPTQASNENTPVPVRRETPPSVVKDRKRRHTEPRVAGTKRQLIL